MAPMKPKSKERVVSKRTSAKPPTSYPGNATGSAFTTSKKDKQLMKRSLFMSKVQDSGVKKSTKRRPRRKLVANLESLEDAIDEVEKDGLPAREERSVTTLKSGRGATKRREKVVKEESERFGMNMAILNENAQTGANDAQAGQGRWAALRAHIQKNSQLAIPQAGPSEI